MSCEVYEQLQHQWEVKWHAEILAHDGYKGGSIKSALAERSRTNSERIAAEVLKNNHIKECDICKREGRIPSDVDPHQPFF